MHDVDLTLSATRHLSAHHQAVRLYIIMPGRTRPIEKLAEATAKCSPEVGAQMRSLLDE